MRPADGPRRRGGGGGGGGFSLTDLLPRGRPAVDHIHTSAPGGGGGDDVQRTVEEALQELASQLDIAEGTAEAIAWQEEHVGVPLEPFDLPTDPVLQPGQRRKGRSEGVALGGNSKMKAIIRPKDVFRIYPSEPHFFKMARGKTVAQPSAAIRLNHYWGARLTNFGPDTYDVLEQIQTDDSIQPIVDNLKRPFSSLAAS
eukprot:SM000205S06222  [mRNA]  locus=s205:102713:104949:+ [translate_table: standard]